MPVSADLYDRDYFLSHRCEGYEYFRAGELSHVRKHEIEALRLEPGMRLLDAGCGRGEILRAAHDRGLRVAGIDYSEAAVALSRETLADVADADIRHGDVTRLPWGDDGFDRVLCGDVIEHLDAAQAEAAVNEFRRVLRPGGVVLVHTAPNRLFRNVSWPILRHVLRFVGAAEPARLMDDYLADLIPYHVNEQSLASLRRLLDRAGLHDVRAWIDPDVTRSASHRLTRDLARGRLFTIGARIAGTWPLIVLFGNDLYATGTKPVAATA